MKKFIMISRFFVVLLLLSATGCTFSSRMPKGKNIQICIELDSTISAHEQWVYLHRYIDNEHVIDDSTFIKKGQKEIRLYAYTEKEHWFSILFSEKGPIDWYLILAPNSYVTTSVSESDGIVPAKKVAGSYSTNENFEKTRNSFLLNQKKRDLYAQLSMPRLTDEENKSITARITEIDRKLDSIQMNIVLNSYSSHNTIGALQNYFKGKISKDSLKTLCNIALKRFPDNEEIKRIIRPVRIVYPPESEESQQINNRLNNIIERRLSEELEVRQTTEAKTDPANITKISLPSNQNEMIAISQLKGKYLLIDFWASWCIPCREGMPYLRQAKKEYGESLTICLISLDKKHSNWKHFIDTDNLHEFINLTAIDEKGNIDKNIEKMNITSIPYNILLDENHHIIATDLHKKDLLNKLDELIK